MRALLLVMSCLCSTLVAAEVTYPPVVPGHELEFPRDEGSHPDFRIEWWYVTGQLDDGVEQGQGTAWLPGHVLPRTHGPGRGQPQQLRAAPGAVRACRVGRSGEATSCVTAQRSARTGFDLAYAREGGLDVKLDDWSIRQVSPGRYVTTVRGEDFDFNLTLASTQPPLLQGERGFSRKGPDPRAASYYYSLPQLDGRPAKSTVDGRARKVTGRAWFDHEWSSDYVDASALGWDWLGVNLHDGGALMAFRMRDRQGGERWASATCEPLIGDSEPSPALRATSPARPER